MLLSMMEKQSSLSFILDGYSMDKEITSMLIGVASIKESDKTSFDRGPVRYKKNSF